MRRFRASIHSMLSRRYSLYASALSGTEGDRNSSNGVKKRTSLSSTRSCNKK